MTWRIAVLIVAFTVGVPVGNYWMSTLLSGAGAPFRPLSEWYLGLGYAFVALWSLDGARGPVGFVLKTITGGSVATVALALIHLTLASGIEHFLASLVVAGSIAFLSVPVAAILAIPASLVAGLPSVTSEWRWFWSDSP